MEKEKLHELFYEAKGFIKSRKTISCSELQIHFKIGYNSVGRLMDQLEANECVGHFQGDKQRRVLIK